MDLSENQHSGRPQAPERKRKNFQTYDSDERLGSVKPGLYDSALTKSVVHHGPSRVRFHGHFSASAETKEYTSENVRHNTRSLKA